MKQSYRIERPSGHVIKRFEAATLEQADKELERQINRRGGYLTLYDEADNDEVGGGGTIEPREFTVNYIMGNGGKFKRGTACEVQSKTRTDVHVLVNTRGLQWELFTLPRGDFYKTTKRSKESRY